MGPKPMQLVVVMAVRKAVRAATIITLPYWKITLPYWKISVPYCRRTLLLPELPTNCAIMLHVSFQLKSGN